MGENKAESSIQVILLNKPDKLLLEENWIKQKQEISVLSDIWDFRRLRNRKTFTQRITHKVITNKNWVLFKLFTLIEFLFPTSALSCQLIELCLHVNIARGLWKNHLITTFFLKGETASLLLDLSDDHLCRFYYIKAQLQLIHICQMLSEMLKGTYCSPGQLELTGWRENQ